MNLRQYTIAMMGKPKPGPIIFDIENLKLKQKKKKAKTKKVRKTK